MSRSDIERWEQRYRARGDCAAHADPLLTEYGALFDGRGDALDVACGRAANALHLAASGYRAWGIDGSLEALASARRAACAGGLELRLLAADLDSYPLPRRFFHCIVVLRYLNRALAPALVEALRPGGVLLHRTFNRNHLARVSTFNPSYLLAPGELSALYPGMVTIATDDGPRPTTGSTFWIGRRPG